MPSRRWLADHPIMDLRTERIPPEAVILVKRVEHSRSDEEPEGSDRCRMMMVFASYGWENIGDDRVSEK
jgi:hypothetical protein